ncbi:MAG: phenylalanine--tRNA ligase subunit beta [Trueperaceae bacterium]
MKVPYSWLQEFIAELPPVDELAALCDGLGLASGMVHRYDGAAAGTVAVVLESVAPVPGSDHLLEARAFDGRDHHQVLTAASNARAGLITAFAAPGVLLPALGATTGTPVERREMAGLESAGVLLSPRELGVFEHAGGLIEFPVGVEPGSDLASLWPGDDVLELELTANRADAFSLLGVARDVAAKLGVPYRHPAAGLEAGNPALDDGLTIQLADTAGCPAFSLRRIDEVQVGPSPLWLQRRLASVGLRPRNNVVDVTNFVTFELGQPSHAYDATALPQGVIQVRRATAGERLQTLGGDELELDPADLVIATPHDSAPKTIGSKAIGSKAIGLAGVIGGLEGSVGPSTTGVALEAAYFDPVTVRRTAKRHGISTDAHYRFERGVDPNLARLALARASELIADLAGGRLHSGVSWQGETVARPAVRFRPSRVLYLMDFEVPPATQRSYLEALGCGVEEMDEDSWRVSPPSWRFDLAIEEDLVEEVGRLHGYEHVGETVPVMRFVPPRADPTHRGLRDEIAGLGFQEAIGYIFTSEAELTRAAAPEPRVYLADPQGVERSVLRTALYPGLLAAAVLNRPAGSLALFEVGRIFLEQEFERVALLARGSWVETGWQGEQELDFFLFKGLLERLAQRRNAQFEMRPQHAPQLHPGVAAEVFWNGRSVGFAGRLHPQVAARFELEDTYVAELALPLEPRGVRVLDIPRQPHAERDVAVVAPTEVSYRELFDLVTAAAGDLLQSLEPFDIYQGISIPQGQRSVALRLRFRHGERALRDEEVDGCMQNVIRALRDQGYDIRDR